MKKWIVLFLIFCSGCCASQEMKGLLNEKHFDRRTDNRLWDTSNLNELLCDNHELRPHYGDRWKWSLAHCEYCPFCGAFSYYHSSDEEGNRKCCRCGQEWKPIYSGNYWVTRKLPY